MPDGSLPTRSARAHQCATVGLSILFTSICIFPYLSRIFHPSLYSDDVLRIANLKTTPLPRLLVRPFNEHLAPIFEVVSWTAWELAGHSLVAARTTFTYSSYVPFFLCLFLLHHFIRKETESSTAALIAVAAFSLSSLSAEVVFWYSASSFSWALVFTLCALIFVCHSEVDREPRTRNLVFSAIASFLAPMGCGLGLLAGPASALRSGFSRQDQSLGNRLLSIILPAAGTSAYLAFGWAFRYQSTLLASARMNADVPIGLWHAIRAPVVVLIRGLFGFSNLEREVPVGFQAVLAFAFWLGLVAWSVRSQRRDLLLVGLSLILGGYGLTYPLRVRKQSLDLLDYQRYHYFPQFGLVILIAVAFLPLLRRFDSRPLQRLCLALSIGVLLLATHATEMRSRANFYRFPHQVRTLCAIERLETLCLANAITRDQAIAAIDPIRTRWFPHDFNALNLLGPLSPVQSRPDSAIRPILLGSLGPGDCEALFGSMDVTPHAIPSTKQSAWIALGRLIGQQSIRSEDRPGHYVASGWPAYLEFEFSGCPERSEARALVFPNWASEGPVEIWWAGDPDSWSEFRSIRWRPDPGPGPRDWIIPLDAVPHLDPMKTRRLRIYFRKPGPIVLAPPRFIP